MKKKKLTKSMTLKNVHKKKSSNEKVFCFIKFGKKEHLEALLRSGEICFNPTELFNQIEDSNKEQGDCFEGAEWIENAFIKEVKCTHPVLGEFKFRPVSNEPFRFIQYHHYYVTNSLYVIRASDFKFSDKFRINEKMLKFGNFALIIKEPNRFLKQLKIALENSNYNFIAKPVDYIDLSRIKKYQMTPFIKKIEHSYQKEFRIVLNNVFERCFLSIGSLEEYSEIVSSNFMTESSWEVNRVSQD